MVSICAAVSSRGKIPEDEDNNKHPDNKLSHFRDRFPRHLSLLQHPSVQIKIRGCNQELKATLEELDRESWCGGQSGHR